MKLDQYNFTQYGISVALPMRQSPEEHTSPLQRLEGSPDCFFWCIPLARPPSQRLLGGWKVAAVISDRMASGENTFAVNSASAVNSALDLVQTLLGSGPRRWCNFRRRSRVDFRLMARSSIEAFDKLRMRLRQAHHEAGCPVRAFDPHQAPSCERIRAVNPIGFVS